MMDALRSALTRKARTCTQKSRYMSMFLWRRVPIYRRDKYKHKKGFNGWSLAKKLTKPATPVRVDSFIAQGSSIDFKHGVVLPDGSIKPFRGKCGHEFIAFWNQWREQWKQEEDYDLARGIPPTRMCQRCDEPMNWIGKLPAKWMYMEVEAKRRLFQKIRLEETQKQTTSTNGEYDTLAQLEHRYCCLNEECGVRDARIEFRHNTAEIVVLEGLTDKQWKLSSKHSQSTSGKIEKRAKALGALSRALEARDALADGTWFKGCPTFIHKVHPYTAPYLNNITHEEAMQIVAEKARARHKKVLDSGRNPPPPFTLWGPKGYVGGKWKRLKTKLSQGQIQ